MLVDPESFRADEDRAPYPVLAAKRRSRCPHCLITIEPGDAIVLRDGDRRYSHEECAAFASRVEADPDAVLVEELIKWRAKQLAVRRCEGPRPRVGDRKRKARAA